MELGGQGSNCGSTACQLRDLGEITLRLEVPGSPCAGWARHQAPPPTELGRINPEWFEVLGAAPPSPSGNAYKCWHFSLLLSPGSCKQCFL